ncbi:MAG: ceramidase domain-containing protein [Pseudomonadota bacterium]
MDELARQVDAYCERLGPGFWAEPINALSNAAFLIGALVAWGYARRLGRTDDWGVVALTGVLAAIGTGSFLFHTFATRWASMADVIPIMIFILLYLYLTLRRYLGLPVLVCAALTAGWMVASPVVGNWLQAGIGALNGSIMYVPTWGLMALFAALLALRPHPAWKGVAGATGLLTVSLVFRTLDDQHGPVCAAFPWGLHWGWHLFNGTLLGLLIGVFAAHGAREGAGGRVARAQAAG